MGFYFNLCMCVFNIVFWSVSDSLLNLFLAILFMLFALGDYFTEGK